MGVNGGSYFGDRIHRTWRLKDLDVGRGGEVWKDAAGLLAWGEGGAWRCRESEWARVGSCSHFPWAHPSPVTNTELQLFSMGKGQLSQTPQR